MTPRGRLASLALILATLGLLVISGSLSAMASAHTDPTPSAPAPSSGVTPAAHPAPLWNSQNFSHDVEVSFSLPGSSTFGTQFTSEPVVNQVPEHANGFWMNISTDSPLIYANVTIWGTQWPVQDRQAPIPGFKPEAPVTSEMLVNSTQPNTASFYFNDYRFFWPGDTVFFNLTLTGLGATPGVIYSTNPWSYPDGPGLTASWIFFVQGPWTSENFSDSAFISTSPSVLTSPAFDPNPDQPLQISVTALAPPGLAVGTIPAAQVNYTVTQDGFNTTRYADFAPVNHTTVELAAPIGPYENAEVNFNIVAWLPWEGGAIDLIYSPVYTFSWSTYGGWAFSNQGLLANLELVTYPNVLPPTNGVVGAGTPVNVTIHEEQQNITLGAGQVNYVFADGQGRHSGVLPMTSDGPNTSFAVIPGLPPSSSLTFFVSAKDIYGTPVFSKNYTYSAGRLPTVPYPIDREVFFFEALDLAGTGLVANLNYTISNASWSETGNGYSLGFGTPLVPHGLPTELLALGYGTYQLSITAFGRTYSTSLIIDNSTPFTVLFYVASGPVSESTVASLPAVPIGAVLGLVGAVVALAFVWPWFSERRKRAEEEQRRVTL